MINLEKGEPCTVRKDILTHMSIMKASEYEGVSARCYVFTEPDKKPSGKNRRKTGS